MHQILCAVDAVVMVDGYRFQVIEVTATSVRIGVSALDSGAAVHEIRLTDSHVSQSGRPLELSSRSAIH